MSLFFSRQCEYAIQGVLYLALKPRGEMTSIKELASRLGIPYHFLAKILQNLTHKGLLASQKGPTGGFSLGKPAEEMTIYQVVEAIDGPGLAQACVLGFRECSSRRPCSVHEQWAGIRDSISGMLMKKSIATMAQEMKKPGYPQKAGRNFFDPI
jgi:Rrf2 family iron-sulfur cluster assembly transcriptional regulator